METLVARSPTDSSDLSLLSGLAPELAMAFASLTGDIALVIDDGGVIRKVAVAESASGQHAKDWVGRSWAETVTGDTRRKIELLLKEADASGVARRREVNHPSVGGADMPVSYSAIRLGLDGPVIALGRDLRAVAAIQQRFVEAQQEMERDYWKLRQEAARQRLLAQVATDAVMVVDAGTLAVCQINATAEALFGPSGSALPLPIEELLATVARTGRAAEVRTRLAPLAGAPRIDLSATPFNAGVPGRHAHGAQRLLLRARSSAGDGTSREGESVAVTDSSGRVMAANAAFRELCRSGAESVDARTVVELLGDPQRHLAALLVDVRREGLVYRPAMLLGGGRTPTFECTVQAALMADGDQECIGLTLVPATPAPSGSLPNALAALLEQIGDLPLAEAVRLASDLTERHAVETALRRAAADRQKTAALLGVTTDDLDERLRRLGLAG